MESLFERLGPGVHRYSPFDNRSDGNESLLELCRNAILKSVTIRRLSTAVKVLRLPKPLKKYVSDLTTADFEKIECAPFSDTFSFSFLFRALTYRVVCKHDGLEYMLTYGYSPVDKFRVEPLHNEWVNIQHKNVMCICATVQDPGTENVFYVYDQPRMTLDQMWAACTDKNHSVPEIFYWRVTADLCEASKFILTNGLRYSHFWLDNIFIVGDRLVLENGLMRKGVKYTFINSKGEDIDEKNVLRDIMSILKYLVQNRNRSESLQRLVEEIETENSIDVVLDLVNHSVQNLHSFSFTRLIRSMAQ